MKTKRNNLTSQVLDQIISILNTTHYGQVTLVLQDYCLVQIERNEKFRPQDPVIKLKAKIDIKERIDPGLLRQKIREACDNLGYGQVVIVVKEGKIVQFDRTQKQRFSGVEGLFGDGI